MVRTQFNSTIHTLRTDNGREYFNSVLSPYLSDQGIIHQSSCPDTPQQNGISERKNWHLLDVARAIMFTMNVPKYLWGEAVLTACYLINRMPSKILNFQTPLNTLLKAFPLFHVPNLPAKIFGCKAFVHNHQPNQSKLDPRAHTCIFIGYSPTQKGYKCYQHCAECLSLGMLPSLKMNHTLQHLIFRGRFLMKMRPLILSSLYLLTLLLLSQTNLSQI